MAELYVAQALHPVSSHNIMALVKQVGDVSKAVLHHQCPDGPPPPKVYDLRGQLLQTAAIAIRTLLEGDQSLGIQPMHSPGDGSGGKRKRTA
jgi:hypothetical protein